MPATNDVSVFIDPVTPHFLRNELFNTGSAHNIDDAHAPYFHIKELFESQGIAFLQSLSAADIRRYKENARDYLRSTQFVPFKQESFAQLFTRAVAEDVGISLRHTVAEPISA